MTFTGPMWVYHKTEKPRIVTTQEEYDKLGSGWADTPAAFVFTQTLPLKKEAPVYAGPRYLLVPKARARGR